MAELLNFKNRYLRRRAVVMAVLDGGHIDAVATEFGVSRASVYNWVRAHEVTGATGLVHPSGDKRFAWPGLTPFATLNFIRAAVVRHPGWSADKLAKYLGEMGREIQPRTLRNMFKQLGVSSARSRRSKASEWRLSSSAELEISEEDLVFLSELDALPSGEVKGRRPGEVLVQDRVKLPKGLCDEPMAVELVIDTFAPMRRIFATLGPPCDQLSLDALDEARAIYQREGLKIQRLCTPRKAQYAEELGAFDYPRAVVNEMRAGHHVRPVNAKKFDSRIQEAWNHMLLHWLKPMKKKFMSPQPFAALESDLEEWIKDFRLRPRT